MLVLGPKAFCCHAAMVLLCLSLGQRHTVRIQPHAVHGCAQLCAGAPRDTACASMQHPPVATFEDGDLEKQIPGRVQFRPSLMVANGGLGQEGMNAVCLKS